MMSPLRKKLQAKLRRKYNYSTNTNYGRGVVLSKIEETPGGYYDVKEIAIESDNTGFTYSDKKPIHIYVSAYNKEKGDRYVPATKDIVISFTEEEIDLITQVLSEFRYEKNCEAKK